MRVLLGSWFLLDKWVETSCSLRTGGLPPDYCKMPYMGLPLKKIPNPCLVQKVMGTCHKVHIKLILQILDQLSIFFWLQFKMLFLTSKAPHRLAT